MALQDLPTELFQQVTHELINVAGIRGSWRLRGVSRTFAAEIEYDILAKRPRTTFRSYYDHRILKKCLDRYLFHRLHVPLDIDKSLLGKIEDLVNYLIDELGVVGHQQREEITKKFCQGLKTVVGDDDLLHALWCSGQDCHYMKCKNWLNKLTAALAIEDCDLVKTLLPDLDGHQDNVRVSCFKPLDAAISMKSKTFLELFLRYLRSMKTSRPNHFQDLINGGSSTFSISSAIRLAILKNNIDAAQTLLGFHQKHLPAVSKMEWILWTTYAIRTMESSTNNFLPAILKNGRKQKFSLDPQTLTWFFDVASRAMITETLAQFHTDINEGSILNLPLFIAVRSGNANAVHAAVDAGADVNIAIASNIPTLSTGDITPIQVAIHRRAFSVIDALVNRDALLPHVSKWPTHGPSYNFLRDLVLKKTAVQLPVLKAFKKMSMKDRKALRY